VAEGASRSAISGWWSKLRGNPAKAVTDGASATVAVDEASILQAEFERGVEHHRNGRLDEAEAVYLSLLQRQPKAAEVLHSLGVLQAQRQNLDQALVWMGRAADAAPGHVTARLNRGNLLRALGRREEALSSYNDALGIESGHLDTLINRAALLMELGRREAALLDYELVLKMTPDHLETLLRHGGLLLALDRPAEAVSSYERALTIKPDFVEALNSRGIAQARLGRRAEALESYDRAVNVAPGNAETFNNRGALLADMGRYEEALASYDRAIAIKPEFPGFIDNRAGLLRMMGRHEQVAQAYSRLLQLTPDDGHALGHKLYADTQICEWSKREADIKCLLRHVESGAHILPFTVLVTVDSGVAQLECARNYARRKYPVPANNPFTSTPGHHGRIRVAYLSADFHLHATAQLMAELFERHDRERFEVSAWSFGPETGDAMRARLRAAFEHFHDVRDVSDGDLVTRLRAAEIDIAVDLKGYSKGCRPGVFAKRVAPVQVNYLVYPGTTGADYMDYIIGDAEVIPEGDEVFYSEQVVRLPDSYQVNDTKRVIAGHVPTRAEAGLPASGFVFCCFNNNYKITPEVFDVWMRLLKAVPGSVLWLLEDNAAASRNLRREAQARGVDAGRLVFAGRVLPPDHLARHRVADLFLDTLPCNAHTTASDALWAGLPVLTCRGNAFAGRVAASLLRAVGLPELVVDDLGAYETLAIRLATAPGELAGLKARLLQNRLTHPLFDIERYRRHLESAYAAMIEQHRQGKSPRGFSLQAMY
jgi:protein O-GlcNAc transferase